MKPRNVLSFLVVFSAVAFLFSCGENSSNESVIVSEVKQFSEDNPLSNHRTIEPDYSGKVVVKFKDGTDVRLSSFDGLRMNGGEGPFISAGKAITSRVNDFVRPELVEGRVTNISRVTAATEEEVDNWCEYWAKQGVELHDWNL